LRRSGKGKRTDVYLEVRKRRGHIFFEWNKCLWPIYLILVPHWRITCHWLLILLFFMLFFVEVPGLYYIYIRNIALYGLFSIRFVVFFNIEYSLIDKHTRYLYKIRSYWWRLFQKSVLHTKLDNYVFILQMRTTFIKFNWVSQPSYWIVNVYITILRQIYIKKSYIQIH
jgi:hypothetical protein